MHFCAQELALLAFLINGATMMIWYVKARGHEIYHKIVKDIKPDDCDVIKQYNNLKDNT